MQIAEFINPYSEKNLKKGEIITKQGNVENYLSLIISGIARLYFEKEDKEITLDFAFNIGYLTAYEFFLIRAPSVYTIEALANIELWRATHESFIHFDKIRVSEIILVEFQQRFYTSIRPKEKFLFLQKLRKSVI